MVAKKKAGRKKGKIADFIGITLPIEVIELIDAIQKRYEINSRSACINYLLQAIITLPSKEDRKELHNVFMEVMTIGEALPIIQTFSKQLRKRPHKELLIRLALTNKPNWKYLDKEQKKWMQVWGLAEVLKKKLGEEEYKRKLNTKKT